MSAAASHAERTLPLPLRAAYVLWFVAWLGVYFGYFGWQFLLWFCCLANVYVLLGMLTGRALWFSLAAIAALAVQLIHVVDAITTFAFDHPLVGVTAQLLGPTRPLAVRVLSLFHLWMPLLLGYAIARLGYDRRAVWIQSAVAVCVLPLCFYGFDPSLHTNDAIMPRVDGLPFDRDFNINWVHAFYDHPEPDVGMQRFWIVLFGYPLAFHLPMHMILSGRDAWGSA